jgi:ubiquinone/menaquinone biosynthesis C-methylase UbiE
MLMYGWMVFVEHAPERYDWAVKVLTGGRIDQIKDDIANDITPGMRVLDIGCGTGTLAMRMIDKGAHVYGLDISPFMIKEAQRRADEAGVSEKLTLFKDSVTQVRKHIEDGSLDMIVSTMALGEFPREYLDYILTDCKKLLKPGGRIAIADEVLPQNWLLKAFYFFSMVLLWIPQFVLLRRAFFPIQDLVAAIRHNGFNITGVRTWALSTFQLVRAEPPSS